MIKTVRVIGIGSPVAGDSVGMQLVERLRDDPQWQRFGEIEWLLLERPGASLLHYLNGVEVVCLVDALEYSKHGGVVRIEAGDLLAADSSLSSHNFGVTETLHLASALNQLPSRLLIYGVVGGDDNYADLSRMLAADLGN